MQNMRLIYIMRSTDEREERFLAVADRYKEVVAKVCWVYASTSANFEDLYQEVLVNIWQGLDSFRGEAKMSTWIYRTAINTCITWHRRNGRHGGATTVRLDDVLCEPVDDSGHYDLEGYRELYALISRLGSIDKALVTLWLDGHSYDEIASIMGISVSNVGVRFYRIKEKLSKMANT